MNTNPQRLGKYELLERLGQGGIATVWKARDTQLQRYVAIKILHANLQEDPNFTTRFEREAQFIASLHHPNIVQIHDFHVTSPLELNAPTAYMVMDYIEGGTLADYIATTSAKGAIPSPAQIVHLFTSISLAVDYAHTRGMIHRDIKPANILLDKHITARNPMGEPILSDFGVAKMLAASSNVLSGSLAGTPLYISPEQARGYPGNERSDIYSLGVILYEMVTGVRPFRGDNPMDVIMQHINATPVPPALINPNIPASLSTVIIQALAKDPDARFASAAAMTAAIAGALHMPVPENLRHSGYLQDALGASTSITPLLSTPVSGSEYAIQQPPPDDRKGSPSISPLPPSTRVPARGTPTDGSGGVMQQQGVPLSPTRVPARGTPTSLPLVRPRRRRSILYIALAVLAIIVLLGSGLGTYLLFFRNGTPAPVSSSQAVGQAYFISTGQYDPASAQGIADELEIDLQNIPTLQAGNSYYAWLLGDRKPHTEADPLQPTPLFTLPLLLTPTGLPVKNGKVGYLYKGTANHDNLLSLGSRLLVTEESARGTPRGPAANRSAWRYYAEIPQTPYGNPSLSALDHIRHLFYKETKVFVLGLPGGLDVWLLRNTEKLMEWGVAARDDYNVQGIHADQMRSLFISMLDYLDGAPNVGIDVPGGPVEADQTTSRVALLSIDPVQQQLKDVKNNPLGYIDHVPLHLNGVIKAPDATPRMRKLASQILDALTNVKMWLNDVRSRARQLALMDTNQLSQAQTLTIIDGLLTEVTYAYIGKLDPATNQLLPGVLQAHHDVQQLATLTITAHLPQNI
jgi:serine/threonine-protein kinase